MSVHEREVIDSNPDWLVHLSKSDLNKNIEKFITQCQILTKKKFFFKCMKGYQINSFPPPPRTV